LRTFPSFADFSAPIQKEAKAQQVIMATSQAAYAAEKAIGHDGSAILEQDISNYEGEKGAGEKMKALVWQGKNAVQVGLCTMPAESQVIYR